MLFADFKETDEYRLWGLVMDRSGKGQVRRIVELETSPFRLTTRSYGRVLRDGSWVPSRSPKVTVYSFPEDASKNTKPVKFSSLKTQGEIAYQAIMKKRKKYVEKAKMPEVPYYHEPEEAHLIY